jgi:hypothetical protein
MKPGICCLAAILGCLSVEAAGLAKPVPLDVNASSPIERFLTRDGPPLREYRARRTLRAVNPRFHARATLEAMTELAADGTFRYEILREEGSGSVRTRVLHAVLRDEQRMWQQGDPRRSSLSLENYSFRLEAGTADGGSTADEAGPEPLIAITPLRRDILLVDGRIAVDESGDLRRVEGRLSKSPSFWTSRVDVVRRYARIAGVRVPVLTTSVAYVKIAGRSEFEMTYGYESINGKRVGQAAPAP